MALLRTPPNPRFAVVVNKGDLPPALSSEELRSLNRECPIVTISAQTGEGIDRLLALLADEAALPQEAGLTSLRHIDAARRAANSIAEAASALREGAYLDMAAIDLRNALSALYEITGEEITERLLDAVFANFCVGK